MALPGKLAIGLIQEDNPVKAYFRFKPQYILENGNFECLDAVLQDFPEDGGIRIVPDKNELTYFKTRMRELGRYCALDLRKHPGENEKIRPNKNFGVGAEHNAYIVYSDVVCATPPGVCAEIVDAQYVFASDEVTLRVERPGTKYVVIRREGQLSGPWVWQDAKDIAGCVTFRHAPDIAPQSIDEAELSARVVSFMEEDAAKIELLCDLTRFGVPDTEPEAAPSVAPEPMPEPTSAPPVSERAQESEPAPMPEPEPDKPEPAPEPVPEPAKAPPAPEPDKPANAEKPWIQKSDLIKPQRVNTRLSLREQALQAQIGINPRKGRSLSEVVDEQWRRSRFDQLGHPIPGEATAMPVVSPIERALQATKEAWALPEARVGLVDGLAKETELARALAEKLDWRVGDQTPKHDPRIDELEAEKLRVMTELDALRIKRQDVKAQLMEDLRQAHRQEFDKLEAKNLAIKSELEHNEAAAHSAKMAAEAAEQMLKKTSEEMDQQLLSHVMTQRAMELVMHLRDRRPATAKHPVLYEPTAGELLSDMRVQLESAGFKLDNDDMVNLLASMLTGGMAVVSGASGTGKSQLVRRLAAALGLTGPARRFVEARAPEDDAVRELIDLNDGLTPIMVLFDDINLADDDESINGAIRLQEEARARDIPLCIMMTVQDAPDGRALSARLLARAFLIRLDPTDAQSAWKPPELIEPSPDRAVALSALRDILRATPDLPGDVEERLRALRLALEKIRYTIDRRTLNELWQYCASVRRASRLPSLQVLDRALAQRALPVMMASMELDQLRELPKLFCDMPRCMKLMDQPLPLPPV